MTETDVPIPADLFHPLRADLRLTDVLFALSDPARLDILRQLAAGPLEMAQCHLINPDVPKSTKSHHMKVLREAGVLRNDAFGRGRRLCLRAEDLEARFPGLLEVVLHSPQGEAQHPSEGQAECGPTSAKTAPRSS